MIIVGVIACALAIYGHATLVATFRFIALFSLATSILGVAFVASHFHAVHGGNYLLGTFWPTWFFSFVLAASLPISWGPFIGDYGRYIPERESELTTATAGFIGILGGCLISELIGAFATAAFKDPATPFALGFPERVPLAVAVFLMLGPGGLANIESAAMSVYNCALDVHALLWRITRVQLTLGMSVIGVVIAWASTGSGTASTGARSSPGARRPASDSSSRCRASSPARCRARSRVSTSASSCRLRWAACSTTSSRLSHPNEVSSRASKAPRSHSGWRRPPLQS
jgi:purine-cytosine permease-like protein